MKRLMFTIVTHRSRPLVFDPLCSPENMKKEGRKVPEM